VTLHKNGKENWICRKLSITNGTITKATSMAIDYSVTDKRTMSQEEFERFSHPRRAYYEPIYERSAPPVKDAVDEQKQAINRKAKTLEPLVDMACEAVRESIRAELTKAIDEKLEEFKIRLTSKPADTTPVAVDATSGKHTAAKLEPEATRKESSNGAHPLRPLS
jgi:RNA-binding protein YhbY